MKTLAFAVVMFGPCTTGLAQPDIGPPPPLASLTLSCTSCATPVAPGTPLTWHLTLQLGYVPEDLGLAAFCVDMVQVFGNPAGVALAPAPRPALSSDLARFDRPLGIANPDPPVGTAGSAFGGTPLAAGTGVPDGIDLIQIGGSQNTFGSTGVAIGTSTTVLSGFALGSGGEVIATGSFLAPATPGNYQVELRRGLVNVVTTIGGLGVPSIVRSAIVDLGQPLAFTVDDNLCPADFNHDGVLDPDDLADFIACYFASPPCAQADVNGDSIVDPDDLADYIAAYFAGCD